MPPSITPEAAQLLLPAVAKAMKLMGPKSEQPIQQWAAMQRMMEPVQASPWSKLRALVGRGEEGMQATPYAKFYADDPGRLSFSLNKGGRSLGGTLGPDTEPDVAHLQYLGSGEATRQTTGNLATPYTRYQMDISSPAQRELPLRGKLPPGEKAQRAARLPEERNPILASPNPPIPMADKQATFDAMVRLLRQAGFKKMSFEAEAGERPRLYQSMTGYKPEPQGEATIQGMLERMPGRQQPAAPSPHDWMSQINETTQLTPQYLEQAIGMSADEAVLHGLAKGQGNTFQLTPAGVQDIQGWLRSQR